MSVYNIPIKARSSFTTSLQNMLSIKVADFAVTRVGLVIHPCAKVIALFIKCDEIHILPLSNFLKIWIFKIEVLVNLLYKFH